MRFMALSSLLSMALLVSVLALIWVAYRLKPRRRRVAVSSLTLWAKVMRAHRPLVSRWRWWTSFVLACLIGGAMALALSRPEVPALGAVSKKIVLILDDAPSMAAHTRDGASRWQHAMADARRVVASLGNASEVMVLDTMGRATLTGWMVPSRAWRQLESLRVVAAGQAHVPDMSWSVADVQVHLFTDGVNIPTSLASARVHSVFEPAINLAITAFDTRAHASDATRVEGLVQVFNAGQSDAQAGVRITGPKFERDLALSVPAGETVSVTLDLSQAEAGVYRAQLKADGDALEADNVAYAVVADHHTTSVLLVTRGEPHLEDSLRALPGVRVTVAQPGRYREEARFDAYVFDRYTPAALPKAGTLMFGGTPAGTAVSDVVVTEWDSAHPALRGVAWNDLRVQSAVLGSGDRALVSATSDVKGSRAGALIASGVGDARWIRVGFALDQSNFPLQPGFPVFLGQALNWLAHDAPVLVRSVGNVALDLEGASVQDNEGRSVRSFSNGRGTVFEANTPGVYRASARGQVIQVVANVLDPVYAQINKSELRVRTQFSSALNATPYLARSELWTLLLSVAALLLVLEWFTLTRKVTT